jgi:hypothetical protein
MCNFPPLRLNFKKSQVNETLLAGRTVEPEAIYDLHRSQQGLDPKRLERALEYFDDFYEVIGDEGKARDQMERRCRQT